MRSFAFWCRWLWVASWLLIGFGAAMAVLNRTSAFSAINRRIDPVFWPSALPEGVSAFQGWAYGAWGSTVLGWGVMTAVMVRSAFPRREPWVWWAMAASIAAWYIPDTVISALSGVWVNVVLNTAVLLLFAIPLAATCRACLGPAPHAKGPRAGEPDSRPSPAG